MQALVLLYSPDTSISLGVFITIVGAVVLLAGLVPTLHDVKWVNGLGNLLVFMFCTITGALCITAGNSSEGEKLELGCIMDERYSLQALFLL